MLNDSCFFSEVYVAPGRTDMRRGIDGLSTIVKQQFRLQLYSRIDDTGDRYHQLTAALALDTHDHTLTPVKHTAFHTDLIPHLQMDLVRIIIGEYAGAFIERAAYGHSCEVSIYVDHNAKSMVMEEGSMKHWRNA